MSNGIETGRKGLYNDQEFKEIVKTFHEIIS